jgi:hypothetical protein
MDMKCKIKGAVDLGTALYFSKKTAFRLMINIGLPYVTGSGRFTIFNRLKQDNEGIV